MAKLLKLISNIEFAQAPLRRIAKGYKQPRKPFAGLRRILHDKLPVGKSAEITHVCIKAGRMYNGRKRKHGRCELSIVAMNSHLDPKIPYVYTIKHHEGKFRGKATLALVQKVWKAEVPHDLGAENMHGKITTANLAIAIEKRKAKLTDRERYEEGVHERWVIDDPLPESSSDYSTTSLGNRLVYPRE
tara:strand:+ start:5499 stop:6062 length:564 start_codon:yes stop_codon:yes gene_type:complete